MFSYRSPASKLINLFTMSPWENKKGKNPLLGFFLFLLEKINKVLKNKKVILGGIF